MKALLALVVSLVALTAAAPAGAADRVLERGILQSVGPAAIVLRALDGTDVTVAVGPSTRYRLNGRRATLAAMRRGLVAEAVTLGGGPALAVRAFGRPAVASETGVVVRVGSRALVLRRPIGDRIRIGLAPGTTVLRGNAAVRRRALRPGLRVEVALAGNGTARVVRILRPGA